MVSNGFTEKLKFLAMHGTKGYYFMYKLKWKM